MKVISVNVGQPETVLIGKKATTSGIDKRPVAGRVMVTAAGLSGDHVLNTKHHGGPDQAVYVYTSADYDFWTEQVGEPFAPGTFGENLTLDAPETGGMRVGDRLTFSSGLELEVTAPRIPCATFAAFVGDPAFAQKFARAGRPGLYLRVIHEGDVGEGDSLTLTPAPDDAPTILELFQRFYDKTPSRERLEFILRFPVAERLRRDVEEQLQDMA